MRWMILLPTLLFLPCLRAQAPAKTLNEVKAFFAANCVKCHGTDGSGHAADGKKLGGLDFTDKEKVAQETDAEMVKTIQKGKVFGIVMPSFKDRLSEDEIRLLIREVLRKAEKGKVIAPE